MHPKPVNKPNEASQSFKPIVTVAAVVVIIISSSSSSNSSSSIVTVVVVVIIVIIIIVIIKALLKHDSSAYASFDKVMVLYVIVQTALSKTQSCACRKRPLADQAVSDMSALFLSPNLSLSCQR